MSTYVNHQCILKIRRYNKTNLFTVTSEPICTHPSTPAHTHTHTQCDPHPPIQMRKFAMFAHKTALYVKGILTIVKGSTWSKNYSSPHICLEIWFSVIKNCTIRPWMHSTSMMIQVIIEGLHYSNRIYSISMDIFW